MPTVLPIKPTKRRENNMNIYIITQHKEDPYCGAWKVWFDTEAYTDKQEVEARLEYLVEDLGKWSGLYYLLERVELDAVITTDS